MLIAAAWYQVLACTEIGFAFTPLAKAADSPLEALRARARPEDCVSGPTFVGARITADLAADGVLLDFKSAAAHWGRCPSGPPGS
ncbi:hypothetical protein [Streptomyces fulvoviolaceus]|uniref:hypothetical protein n=1 Tax=Streptomyces fulvoviolaceus TaxID=285535 RepID=UPI0021C24F71|nr:hypothetical protein [Streptomyces fulvoviolaceus]MCT9081445.1 hypothetical protein [Streptomyces fulvoviolaceus]